MAATLWRIVLFCELALAIGAALAAMGVANLPAWSVIPLSVGALLLIQALTVAGFTLVSRALAHGDETRHGVGPLLHALISESASFALAKIAMSVEPYSRDFRVLPDAHGARVRPVLLVHGLVCNRGIWHWLLRRLRTDGFAPVHAVNLEPLCGDIDQLAGPVARELRAMHEQYGVRVTVIAHSMGGFVARVALRTVGPAVIEQIITLATPHQGAAIARVLPWPALKQMRPASGWLAALNASQEGHWRVPVTSVYSLEDNFVTPARSPLLAGAISLPLRGLGHFGLLTCPKALNQVMSLLRQGART